MKKKIKQPTTKDEAEDGDDGRIQVRQFFFPFALFLSSSSSTCDVFHAVHESGLTLFVSELQCEALRNNGGDL